MNDIIPKHPQLFKLLKLAPLCKEGRGVINKSIAPHLRRGKGFSWESFSIKRPTPSAYDLIYRTSEMSITKRCMPSACECIYGTSERYYGIASLARNRPLWCPSSAMNENDGFKPPYPPYEGGASFRSSQS